MENINFMEEVKKIVLEALRKQGFSVMLLMLSVAFLYRQNTEQKQDLAAHVKKWDVERESLTLQVYHCNQERSALAVEVASLKVKIELLFTKKRI